MWWFLVPLLAGFALGGASAFTAEWSRRWGERGGQRATALLRSASVPAWSVGYVLAAITDVPRLYDESPLWEVTGWAIAIAGAALIAWTLRFLGRRAVAPSLGDAVETGGPYARMRHPVYAGMVLELVGVFLVVPKPTLAIACVLGVVWLLVQARLEERDLLQRAPGYRAYMNTVPRFLPRA